MAGVGRPRTHAKPEVQLSKFVHLISEQVKRRTAKAMRDNNLAAEASLYVLNDIQKTHPTYDNYSGNLNRSYQSVVKVDKNEFVFMTDPNSIPKPQVARERERLIVTDSEGGFENRPKRQLGGRHYFYITVDRRHRKNGKGKIGRFRHQWNRRVRERKRWEPDGMHQYKGTERLRFSGRGKTHTIGRYRGGKAKNAFYMQVSNPTPYAEQVAKSGYTVINERKQLMYTNKVAKMVGRRVSVSINNFCKEFNRDSRGRFVKE